LAIDQPFLTKLCQVFVVESVGDGDVHVVPTVIARLVPADQQNGGPPWVECIERAQWPSIVLGSQLSHLRVLRAEDLAAVREPQCRSALFQKAHGCRHRLLLLFGQFRPPVAKLSGASLNRHLHDHCSILDGVFEPLQAGGIQFRQASARAPEQVAVIAEQVRRRVLRWFSRHGLLDPDDARDRLAWASSGFSLDACVCIAGDDRAGLERRLGYCARPPFALERIERVNRPGHGAGSGLVQQTFVRRARRGPRRQRGQWFAHDG
jgi:hypothetical protein